MSTIGFTDIGKGRKALSIDHDPTSVATDAPMGSLLIDANGKMYRKTDDGETTNVICVAMCKCNYVATVAPTVNDDVDLGYSVGSYWYDVAADKAYVCLDVTDGAAVWTNITGSSVATLIRTTDDIEAILEAAADGSSFWLEDGTHTPSGTITISDKKDISIRGSRAAIVSIAAAGVFKIEGCADITLEGFTVNGGSILIDIVNLGAGTYLSPTRIALKGLQFVGTSSSVGINVTDDFLNGLIENCDFGGTFNSCVNLNGIGAGDELSHTVIRGNRFTTGNFGLGYASNTGVGNVVIGNVFEGNRNQFSGGSGFTVVGNTFKGASAPVEITEGSNFNFIGNVILDSGTEGISIFGGSKINIADNVIVGSTNEGIKLALADDVKITGNLIDNSGADGILIALSAGDRVFVANNYSTNNGGYGLAASVGTGLFVGTNYYVGNTSGPENITVTHSRTPVEVSNRLQTTGATTPTIATIAIPDDTAVLIEVSINAFRTNGADQVAYKKAALVYRRSAGIAVLEAVQDVMTDIESDANFDATIGVDGGNNAIVTVTGVAVKTMEWKSRHTVQEVS